MVGHGRSWNTSVRSLVCDLVTESGCLAGQWQRVARIGTQVASIIDFLHHSAKMFQLDIKPGNLAIDPGSTGITLMDLGSATHMHAESIGRYGTPGYIAPEVFSRDALSEKCDLYSLGMLLYEVISGQNPLIQIQRRALDLVDQSGPPISVEISSDTVWVVPVELPPPPVEIKLALTPDGSTGKSSSSQSPSHSQRDARWEMTTAAIPIDAPALPEPPDWPPLHPTRRQRRYSQLFDTIRTMDLRQRLSELGTPAVLLELISALTSLDQKLRPPAHEVRLVLLPLAEGSAQAAMPRIFLSHSKKDKTRFVYRFASALRRKGFTVWLDEDSLRTGEPFWESIARAIEECDFVVVVLSDNSITSNGVAEELRTAQLQNFTTTKVLPIRIDPIEFGRIPKSLLSRHVLDFVGWEVEGMFQQRCDRLAADIMALRGDRPNQGEQRALS